MDHATLAAYETAASAYANEWETQPAPVDLHDLVKRFFRPGPTADIGCGCGCGRDAAWLAANGFTAVGYDPSAALLAHARAAHPGVTFEQAALPELDGIADGTFDNVLCETVIMHLGREEIAPSVRRMLAILKPDGVLALSWRVEQTDRRDERGRLYSAFDPALVLRALSGATVLLDEELLSPSSGRKIHRLVVSRGPLGGAGIKKRYRKSDF
jgi:2-polyprenyl-3-methyl-5-hydroxy-6-metoxy-1,4-benzoquinol methylase